jgi:hypothetical protein
VKKIEKKTKKENLWIQSGVSTKLRAPVFIVESKLHKNTIPEKKKGMIL